MQEFFPAEFEVMQKFFHAGFIPDTGPRAVKMKLFAGVTAAGECAFARRAAAVRAMGRRDQRDLIFAQITDAAFLGGQKRSAEFAI